MLGTSKACRRTTDGDGIWELDPADSPQQSERARMQGTLNLALVGAGMFGGDVHLRAYADWQRHGISGQLGRPGLDRWAQKLAPLQFNLAAIATRSPASAKRAA